jgi:hypothetical protein
MALCCRRFKKPVTAHHRTNQAGPLLSSIWPTPLTGHSPPWRARGCRAERPPSGQRGSPGVSALLACPQTARQADSLTVARVHNMRPFLLTPGARAAPSPSTLSRLLLPLHLQINGRRNHLRRHVHASSIAPSPISPRLRNRRGRFFASSSSQVRTRLSAWRPMSPPLLNPVPGGPIARRNAPAVMVTDSADGPLVFACLCCRWRRQPMRPADRLMRSR